MYFMRLLQQHCLIHWLFNALSAVEQVTAIGGYAFQNNYLIKTVSLKSVVPEEGAPPVDELQRFNQVLQAHRCTLCPRSQHNSEIEPTERPMQLKPVFLFVIFQHIPRFAPFSIWQDFADCTQA